MEFFGLRVRCSFQISYVFRLGKTLVRRVGELPLTNVSKSVRVALPQRILDFFQVKSVGLLLLGELRSRYLNLENSAQIMGLGVL